MSQCAVKFYFSASPLYMFRAAHTPIIRSTILTVSTAIGTIFVKGYHEVPHHLQNSKFHNHVYKNSKMNHNLGKHIQSTSSTLIYFKETAVAQSLTCCATNRKVAVLIADGVIGIFHWHNLSHHTMALGSTQPPTEMSTRRISWE